MIGAENPEDRARNRGCYTAKDKRSRMLCAAHNATAAGWAYYAILEDAEGMLDQRDVCELPDRMFTILAPGLMVEYRLVGLLEPVPTSDNHKPGASVGWYLEKERRAQ